MANFNAAKNNNKFSVNVNLRVADPSFDTPNEIKDCMKDALSRGLTHYYSTMGLEKLREEISRFYLESFSIRIDPAHEIMTTNGAGEGLYLILNSALRTGDEVIIPNPTYHGFIKKVLHGSVVPRFVPLYEPGSVDLNLKAIKDAVGEKTRAIYICNPNNPTGTVLSMRDVEGLHELLLANRQLLLILDKCYSRILYDDAKYVELLKYEDIRDQLLVVDSFSKTYAMTGWRIGYLIAPESLMKNIEKLAFDVRSSVNTAVQDAAAGALRLGGSRIREMVDAYARRRDIMISFLRRNDLNYITPFGGFEVFMDIRKFGIDSETFAQSLEREVNVSVVPGSEFGPDGEGFIRIVFCASDESLKEGLDRMEIFVKSIAGAS